MTTIQIHQFPAMREKLQLSFFCTFIVHSFSHGGTGVIYLHNTESMVIIVCTTISWSSLVFTVHVYREDTIGGIIGVREDTIGGIIGVNSCYFYKSTLWR